MKAIIYAGIGLFSVATVYGVADFYSSKKKGTLDKLYVEEETPATTPEIKNTVVLPENNSTTEIQNTEAATRTKAARKSKSTPKKMIRMEDFSRARIPEPATEINLVEEPVKKEEVQVVPAKLTETVEKTEAVEPERKLSLDKFSRAPLRKHAKPAKKTEVKN